jgi:hypothetical protein
MYMHAASVTQQQQQHCRLSALAVYKHARTPLTHVHMRTVIVVQGVVALGAPHARALGDATTLQPAVACGALQHHQRAVCHKKAHDEAAQGKKRGTTRPA